MLRKMGMESGNILAAEERKQLFGTLYKECFDQIMFLLGNVLIRQCLYQVIF